MPRSRRLLTRRTLAVTCAALLAIPSAAVASPTDALIAPGVWVGERLQLAECPWEEVAADDGEGSPVREYIEGTAASPCYEQPSSIGAGVPLDGNARIRLAPTAPGQDSVASVVLRGQVVQLMASIGFFTFHRDQRVDELVAQFGTPDSNAPLPSIYEEPPASFSVTVRIDWSLPGEVSMRCDVSGSEEPRSMQACLVQPKTLPDGVTLQELVG